MGVVKGLKYPKGMCTQYFGRGMDADSDYGCFQPPIIHHGNSVGLDAAEYFHDDFSATARNSTVKGMFTRRTSDVKKISHGIHI